MYAIRVELICVINIIFFIDFIIIITTQQQLIP